MVVICCIALIRSTQEGLTLDSRLIRTEESNNTMAASRKEVHIRPARKDHGS